MLLNAQSDGRPDPAVTCGYEAKPRSGRGDFRDMATDSKAGQRPAASGFPHLFTPLQIGPVTIANRIVSSGHDTVMAVDSKVSDQLLAYQEARAAGGAGLIVIQVAGIHPTAKYSSHVLMADDDSCIPGLSRLADAVHAHGTK